MKIKKLQLSGFKSFVDSTTIEINKDMTGIVGPNGCGKSNIVDALRWVMGQSARSLRAANAEDVIFNGTDARKPVGQAAVELIFDNEGSAVPQKFSSYDEIALRRTTDRTRESKYFLNSTRCRQRDVSDLFLGTGLGKHSYAMIEQGMVSRIIEADPKAMRLYIEEAAGVSMYKERRRETELRIRHTRDNLERLHDIREEVIKQLSKLKRQADEARRYKELRLQRDKLQAAKMVKQLREYEAKYSACERQLSDLRVTFEKQQAETQKCEADIERKRAEETQCRDQLEADRKHFYGLAAQLAGIEQDIATTARNAKQIKEEIESIAQSVAECVSNLENRTQRKQEGQQNLIAIEDKLALAMKEVADTEGDLKEQEAILDKAHQELEQRHSGMSDPSESLEVIRIKIDYCDRELQEILNQEREVSEQYSGLSLDELQEQLTEAHARRAAARDAATKNDEQVLDKQNAIKRARDDLEDAQKRAESTQQRLQQMREEMASLVALQAADGGDSFIEWLKSKNLMNTPRLAAKIKPDNEWQAAVETVLGSLLGAVEVDSLDGYLGDFQTAPETFMLFETATDVAGVEGTLASKVAADGGVNALLNQVLLADNLEQALAMRKDFDAQQSAVTKDGVWVGKHWIRAVYQGDQAKGVLARQHLIDELKGSLEQCEKEVEAAQQDSGRLKVVIEQDEKAIDDLQQMRADLLNQATAADQKWRHIEVKANHAKDVKAELDDRSNQIKEWRSSIEQQREDHVAKRDELQATIPDQSDEKTQHGATRRVIDALRSKLQDARTNLHKHEIEKQSLTIQSKHLDESIEQLQQQKEDLEKRHALLSSAEQEIDSPTQVKEDELKKLLSEKQEYEQKIKQHESNLEQIGSDINDIERQRRKINEDHEALLGSREKLRVELNENKIHCDNCREELNKLDMSLEEANQHLDDQMTTEEIEQELKRLNARIEKLAANINLAASQEYESLAERKEYLDSQYNDLTDALESLEQAIARIDKESKERFQETFNNINERLKVTFERLFGGGEAYLELMENNWLRGGCAVMARPPGKRLSSINLLSGGEKALAAVAVIFSIFELNPSPFCILDEVDAPLDEENIERFCDLLKDMSDRVQFIVITHNRLTMEYMDSLLGVTMAEPGVSRLVSVDVDDAVKIANG